MGSHRHTTNWSLITGSLSENIAPSLGTHLIVYANLIRRKQSFLGRAASGICQIRHAIFLFRKNAEDPSGA